MWDCSVGVPRTSSAFLLGDALAEATATGADQPEVRSARGGVPR
jgi:hypothetical protein